VLLHPIVSTDDRRMNKTLEEDGVNSSHELPNGFDARQIAAYITQKFQELILLPTEKCNFRCTYCYEDFELGRMKESTILALRPV
jgi:hypothetical protein